MFIHPRHKASVTRTLSRFATCEKCGCEYTFSVTATGRGEQSANWVTDTRAEAAEFALLDANRQACAKPAACPDCGWYQKWMVPELRRLHNGWLRTSGLTLLGFAGMGVALRVLGYGQTFEGDATKEWIAILVAATIGGILFGVHWNLAARHNPNAVYPQRPPPGKGEPSAARTPQYQARLDAEQALAAQADWFYILKSKHDNVRRGPVSRARLVAMLNERSLSPEDWTWSEGMPDWLPARQALS